MSRQGTRTGPLALGTVVAMLAALALVGVLASPAHALIHAFDCGDPGYSPGDLQAFIDSTAGPGDTIELTDAPCTEIVYIDFDLTLTGDPANRTEIDGGNAGPTVITVDGDPGPVTVFLANLEVTGGGPAPFTRTTPVDGPNSHGNGIYNWAAITVVTNTLVTGNSSIDQGGGVYNSGGGDLTFVDSEISGNTTEHHGGGIYNGGVANGVPAPVGFLTLQNTDVLGNTAEQSGGGIYNGPDSEVDALDSAVDGNFAGSLANVIIGAGGGGIYNNAGIVDLTDTSVGGNEAHRGGGIYNVGPVSPPPLDPLDRASHLLTPGTVRLTGSTVDGNFAQSAGGPGADYYGGGIYNIGGWIELDASQVNGNHAEYDGGGVYSIGADDYPTTVTDRSSHETYAVHAWNGSEISGNTAEYGAGVVNEPGASSPPIVMTRDSHGGCSMLFEDTTIHGNIATDEGGGIYNVEPCDVTVLRSTLSANEAARGGGIYNEVLLPNFTVHVIDSTLSGNHAVLDGGGIYNGGGTVEIAFSTVTANTAGGDGGAVYQGGGGAVTARSSHLAPGTINFEASIVSGNTAVGDGQDCWTGGGGPVPPVSHGYNIFGADLPADCSVVIGPGDTVGTDPELGPLADNGGFTATHVPDDDSPAVDHIPLAYPAPAIDQRGVERPQRAGIDSGSVELRFFCNGMESTILGTVGDDDIDGTGGDDVISTLSGNDVVDGLGGNDSICLGDGEDTAQGGAGRDAIFGGAGNDVLKGGAGSDELYGNAGDDDLFGNIGHDLLSGGDGNDRLNGGAGNDELLGGDGDDVIKGGGNADTAIGGPGNDLIIGGSGTDDLNGGDGDDTINGGGGDDILDGGPGTDTLDGSTGTDVCTGGEVVTNC